MQFTDSGGSLDQVVHWFRWFTGSVLHAVHWFRWFTGSGGSLVHVVHCFRWFPVVGVPSIEAGEAAASSLSE